MNRLSYLFLPLTAIGVSACSSNKAKEEVKRPNIIFMMTDDHTTQAMSCYGGRLLQTPNMDRIANEGTGIISESIDVAEFARQDTGS